MAQGRFDSMHVLIIGVGAAGSMAAWRLTASGHRVTALEQFTLDHDYGSSYGETRIVRRVYPDALYTAMMGESFDLWGELESAWKGATAGAEDAASGTDLLVQRGGLFFAPDGHQQLEEAHAALVSNGVACERLNCEAVADRFPAFHLPAGYQALFEPSMGYARASNAVVAAASLARLAGAEIREQTSADSIEMENGRLLVVDNHGGRYFPDRVLITAGPWTPRFMDQGTLKRGTKAAPLRVTRQVYCHLEPDAQDELFGDERFPVWIDISTGMYGFPHVGPVPGVKIASHNHGAVYTPTTVDRSVSEIDRLPLLRYAAERFPGLSDRVVYEKTCLYTNTIDEDFIIDIGDLPGVFVVSACSGHGFKFAPLIGQIAAELSTDRSIGRDLSRFRRSRFLH